MSSKRKVLLVDRDLGLLRRMRNAAADEESSVELLTAQTWEEAAELRALVSVDLLVGAVEGVHSAGIAQLCLARDEGTRVAVLGPDAPDLIKKVATSGLTSFIRKPLSPAAFFAQLRQLMRPTTGTQPSLSGFHLTDLLQLVSMSRQTMTMRVSASQGSGELCVCDGALVHARTGDQVGVPAAVTVLSWLDSQVSSSPGVLPAEQWTADMPLMELLVDAARMRDEHARDDAKRELEELTAAVLRTPGVLGSALVHVGSGEEVFGDGVDGFDRTLGRALMLDALALTDGAGGAPPERIQMSFESSEVLGARLSDAGVVHIVWCRGAELLSDSLRDLKQLQADLTALVPRALPTIGIDLEGPSDRFLEGV